MKRDYELQDIGTLTLIFSMNGNSIHSKITSAYLVRGDNEYDLLLGKPKSWKVKYWYDSSNANHDEKTIETIKYVDWEMSTLNRLLSIHPLNFSSVYPQKHLTLLRN